MVSPRFARLPPDQQERIVSAAAAEFATHGFHDASLNRVIEAAGISKGSLYYYFDGKEDLYAHVTRSALERFFADHGPFPVPDAEDAEVFWRTLRDYYARVLIALDGAPRLGALIRGWAAPNPALQQAQQDLQQAVMPWLERTLVAGQRAGGVRSDVPNGLLLAAIAGLGQALDLWILNERPDRDGLEELAGVLTGMIRGAVGTPARSERLGP